MGQAGLASGNSNLLIPAICRQNFFCFCTHIFKQYSILRALGPRQTRTDVGEIQAQNLCVFSLPATFFGPEPLSFTIGFYQRQCCGAAPCQVEIVYGCLINGEKAAGRSVFRCHIRNRGTICKGQGSQSRTKKFYEFANHSKAAQLLGNGENQIRGGHALGQTAFEAETNHFGDQHGNRLPQHGGFGLNPADSPAQHPETIDHRCVAVGSHQSIRVSQNLVASLTCPHPLRQIFKVDLMTDSGARRDNSEIFKGFLPPAQKGIALVVAFHLSFYVGGKGIGIAILINHNRMVDDQINRNLGIDASRILAGGRNDIAHGRQINNGGHPGKILHQNPCRAKSDFRPNPPVEQILKLLVGILAQLLVTQQIFEQNPYSHRQPLKINFFLGRQGLKTGIGVKLCPNLKTLKIFFIHGLFSC